ncbi:hypothetical protein [Microcoleus sp. F4-D5]|uniref:hypothetical protein n=1 Tax=Microcoleus sp. F4-D5 TaxID=2818760 RepID=UPI002FCFBA6B
MSRVSSKSSLSPSATRGSSAIDLGKDSGVDMGRKAQPSVTSGGIGVTQEVANIGGMTVTGGVSVELSPVAINISANPSENSISISGSAELPGGILGISGGTTIDTSTGEILGGSIGGEIGGLGINLSSDEGNVGVEFTLQIPGTPVEIGIGFGFPKKEVLPSSPPSSPSPNIGFPAEDIIPLLDDDKCYHCVVLMHPWIQREYGWNPPPNQFIRASLEEEGHGGGVWSNNQIREFAVRDIPLPRGRTPAYIESHIPPANTYDAYWYPHRTSFKANFKAWALLNNTLQILVPDGYKYNQELHLPFAVQSYSGAAIKQYLNLRTAAEVWDVSIYEIPCGSSSSPDLPKRITPSVPLSPAPTPFPNPPPRRQNVDQCCCDNLRLTRLMYTKLGLARFPGELPATIIQEVPKEGEEPAEPPQEPIPDLVSLLDWMFKRDDERWGQWVVQIDVKDADVTKEGDQSKQIKFPNLAESVAEIEGQILSLSTNVDALVAITTKNLVESGLARQEAIKGYLAAKSIIKYMAFKSTEIDVTVPLCFTPGAETIHGLIEESEIHLKGLDYTEKETLRDIFLDLLQAAAIVRAVHWQRIDTKKDTKSQLLGILKGSLDLANSIKNPTRPTDGSEEQKPKEDFEDFLDNAEDGFRNVTGITDMQNPYGKTPDRRPRIRQIGDNIAQAGGNN